MLGSRSDIKVRKGKLADAQSVAEAFRQSWTQAYRGVIPHTHLENMIRRRGADWWSNVIKSGDSLIVIEKAGAIAGYATLGFSRTRGPYQGEIYELYIAPVYQGLGLGEHLFEYRQKGFEVAGATLSPEGEFSEPVPLDLAATRFRKIGYLLAAGGGFGATVPHPSSGG